MLKVRVNMGLDTLWGVLYGYTATEHRGLTVPSDPFPLQHPLERNERPLAIASTPSGSDKKEGKITPTIAPRGIFEFLDSLH